MKPISDAACTICSSIAQGAKRGERVLILREDHRHGYYGEGLAEAVATHAEAMGLLVSVHDVPVIPDAEDLPADVADAHNQQFVG